MEVAQLVIGRLDVPPSWKFAAFVCSRRLHAGSDSPAVAVTSNLSGTKSGARLSMEVETATKLYDVNDLEEWPSGLRQRF